MRRIAMLSLICAGLFAAGCNRINNDRDMNADGTIAGEDNAIGTSGDRRMDNSRQYVLDMLSHGNAEVQLGRLAQQKAENPEVKQFAALMVQDHTKSGDKLKEVAARYNIQGPTSIDDEHTKLMDRLSKLNGAEFDRAYMNEMVDSHEHALDKLEERADDQNRPAGTAGGADTAASGLEMQVTQWASSSLPTVRTHLDKAKAIHDRLGSGFTDKMKQALPNKD